MDSRSSNVIPNLIGDGSDRENQGKIPVFTGMTSGGSQGKIPDLIRNEDNNIRSGMTNGGFCLKIYPVRNFKLY